MLHEITFWKTKNISNLVLPVNELLNGGDLSDGGEPHVVNKKNNTCVMEFENGQTISGTLSKDELTITVKTLNLKGDCSIAFYESVFIPALNHSTGSLEAIIIMYGGSEIKRLTSTNGSIQQETINL